MKRLAVGLALLTAATAHAQKVFRCVDARGGTYYTEKFAPGCKATTIDSAPAAAAAEKAAKGAAAKAAAAKANLSPPTGPNVRQSGPMPLSAKAHCAGLSNEAAQLTSGKSSLPQEVADVRLAGIRQELGRSCR
jgi:hypothetical protein